MIAVPAVLPVTTPFKSTVMDALLLFHEPPAIAPVRVVFEPAQMTAVPVITPGVSGASTVMVSVSVLLPQAPLVV